jgi:hypothetical protein
MASVLRVQQPATLDHIEEFEQMKQHSQCNNYRDLVVVVGAVLELGGTYKPLVNSLPLCFRLSNDPLQLVIDCVVESSVAVT